MAAKLRRSNGTTHFLFSDDDAGSESGPGNVIAGGENGAGRELHSFGTPGWVAAAAAGFRSRGQAHAEGDHSPCGHGAAELRIPLLDKSGTQHEVSLDTAARVLAAGANANVGSLSARNSVRTGGQHLRGHGLSGAFPARSPSEGGDARSAVAVDIMGSTPTGVLPEHRRHGRDIDWTPASAGMRRRVTLGGGNNHRSLETGSDIGREAIAGDGNHHASQHHGHTHTAAPPSSSGNSHAVGTVGAGASAAGTGLGAIGWGFGVRKNVFLQDMLRAQTPILVMEYCVGWPAARYRYMRRSEILAECRRLTEDNAPGAVLLNSVSGVDHVAVATAGARVPSSSASASSLRRTAGAAAGVRPAVTHAQRPFESAAQSRRDRSPQQRPQLGQRGSALPGPPIARAAIRQASLDSGSSSGDDDDHGRNVGAGVNYGSEGPSSPIGIPQSPWADRSDRHHRHHHHRGHERNRNGGNGGQKRAAGTGAVPQLRRESSVGGRASVKHSKQHTSSASAASGVRSGKLQLGYAAANRPRTVTTLLQSRDLRVVDPEFDVAHQPAILVRRHCIVVNLPPVRAIVMADRCLFFPEPGADSDLVPLLERFAELGKRAAQREVAKRKLQAVADVALAAARFRHASGDQGRGRAGSRGSATTAAGESSGETPVLSAVEVVRGPNAVVPLGLPSASPIGNGHAAGRTTDQQHGLSPAIASVASTAGAGDGDTSSALLVPGEEEAPFEFYALETFLVQAVAALARNYRDVEGLARGILVRVSNNSERNPEKGKAISLKTFEAVRTCKRKIGDLLSRVKGVHRVFTDVLDTPEDLASMSLSAIREEELEGGADDGDEDVIAEVEEDEDEGGSDEIGRLGRSPDARYAGVDDASAVTPRMDQPVPTRANAVLPPAEILVPATADALPPLKSVAAGSRAANHRKVPLHLTPLRTSQQQLERSDQTSRADGAMVMQPMLLPSPVTSASRRAAQQQQQVGSAIRPPKAAPAFTRVMQSSSSTSSPRHLHPQPRTPRMSGAPSTATAVPLSHAIHGRALPAATLTVGLPPPLPPSSARPSVASSSATGAVQMQPSSTATAAGSSGSASGSTSTASAATPQQQQQKHSSEQVMRDTVRDILAHTHGLTPSRHHHHAQQQGGAAYGIMGAGAGGSGGGAGSALYPFPPPFAASASGAGGTPRAGLSGAHALTLASASATNACLNTAMHAPILPLTPSGGATPTTATAATHAAAGPPSSTTTGVSTGVASHGRFGGLSSLVPGLRRAGSGAVVPGQDGLGLVLGTGGPAVTVAGLSQLAPLTPRASERYAMRGQPAPVPEAPLAQGLLMGPRDFQSTRLSSQAHISRPASALPVVSCPSHQSQPGAPAACTPRSTSEPRRQPTASPLRRTAVVGAGVAGSQAASSASPSSSARDTPRLSAPAIPRSSSQPQRMVQLSQSEPGRQALDAGGSRVASNVVPARPISISDSTATDFGRQTVSVEPAPATSAVIATAPNIGRAITSESPLPTVLLHSHSAAPEIKDNHFQLRRKQASEELDRVSTRSIAPSEHEDEGGDASGDGSDVSPADADNLDRLELDKRTGSRRSGYGDDGGDDEPQEQISRADEEEDELYHAGLMYGEAAEVLFEAYLQEVEGLLSAGKLLRDEVRVISAANDMLRVLLPACRRSPRCLSHLLNPGSAPHHAM